MVNRCPMQRTQDNNGKVLSVADASQNISSSGVQERVKSINPVCVGY